MLVLDFDGVLCNSIHDSFLTAVNTFIRFEAGAGWPVSEPLDHGSIRAFEKDNPRIIRSFRTILPMGNFAEDYGAILLAIQKRGASRIRSQKAFDAFKAGIPAGFLSDFQDEFFRTRAALVEKNKEVWISLLEPFPGIVESVKTLSKRFVPAIATSKDRLSVDLLLSHWGLDSVFDPKNILDKDFAPTKREHLIRLQKQTGLPFGSIHFIDDKVFHLVLVKDLGVRTYLALWGYNTVREHRIARREGVSLLTLEDLVHLGE